jgi:predicted HNH restriction endonuclease
VSLDSENPSKGMANGSPTLKRYWDEYIERDPSHALLKKRYNDFLNWDINDKPPVYPDELSNNFVGYYEGENKPVLVNQYERDPKARRACIKNYGAVCFICGFDFGETYGKEFTGRIHVHHLVEVSKRAGKYKVDPIKDLRPVCPNCHMVLHCKKDGLYEIDEVKAMLIVERKD